MSMFSSLGLDCCQQRVHAFRYNGCFFRCSCDNFSGFMGDRTRLFSDSSSSDSEGPGAAARTLPPLRFQKKRVREFISELQHPNKLGPTFFSDDDVKEWDSWNSEVPESLGEVKPSDHPLPLMFPAKCAQVSDGAGRFPL